MNDYALQAQNEMWEAIASQPEPKRTAIVSGVGTADAVAKYLPENYSVKVSAEGNGRVLAMIEGNDAAGWTLADYVAPRLQSGLYGCRETDADTAYVAVSGARGLLPR